MNTPPLLLKGPPGTGKTAACYAAASAAGAATLGVPYAERKVHYLPLCERDPMEIAGASYLRDGVCRWAPSEVMDSACREPCLIILDELTAAHRVQRVAALRYADPSSGIHSDTIVLATCNPPEYAAGAGDPLTAPELSRFRVREWPTSHAVRWMCGRTGSERVAGQFLRAHPASALATPEHMRAAIGNQTPFPTPRGWSMAANSGSPPDQWGEFVGDDAAAAYCAWVGVADLPDPDDILNGAPVVIPTRPDVALATATAIVERLGVSDSVDRVGACINWFDKVSAKHAGVISHEADILADRHSFAVYKAARAGALRKYAAIQKVIAK